MEDIEIELEKAVIEGVRRSPAIRRQLSKRQLKTLLKLEEKYEMSKL